MLAFPPADARNMGTVKDLLCFLDAVEPGQHVPAVVILDDTPFLAHHVSPYCSKYKNYGKLGTADAVRPDRNGQKEQAARVLLPVYHTMKSDYL